MLNKADIIKLVTLLSSEKINEKRHATDQFISITATPNSYDLLAETSAISQLVILLKDEDSQTQQYATASVMNLAVIYKHSIPIEITGAIPHLVELLSNKNPETQQSAAGALLSLAADPDKRVLIAKANALPVLVKLISDKSVINKKNFLIALANIALNPDNQIALAKFGAIPILVELLSLDDEETNTSIVAGLKALAENTDNKIAIADAGAIPFLVKLLSCGNKKTQQKAIGTLESLAHDAQNQIRITRAGAIRPLIRLLLDQNKITQQRAISALSILANNPESALFMAQGGAVPLIKFLLFSSDQSIWQCATNAYERINETISTYQYQQLNTLLGTQNERCIVEFSGINGEPLSIQRHENDQIWIIALLGTNNNSLLLFHSLNIKTTTQHNGPFSPAFIIQITPDGLSSYQFRDLDDITPKSNLSSNDFGNEDWEINRLVYAEKIRDLLLEHCYVETFQFSQNPSTILTAMHRELTNTLYSPMSSASLVNIPLGAENAAFQLDRSLISTEVFEQSSLISGEKITFARADRIDVFQYGEMNNGNLWINVGVVLNSLSNPATTETDYASINLIIERNGTAACLYQTKTKTININNLLCTLDLSLTPEHTHTELEQEQIVDLKYTLRRMLNHLAVLKSAQTAIDRVPISAMAISIGRNSASYQEPLTFPHVDPKPNHSPVQNTSIISQTETQFPRIHTNHSSFLLKCLCATFLVSILLLILSVTVPALVVNIGLAVNTLQMTASTTASLSSMGIFALYPNKPDDLSATQAIVRRSPTS